MSQTEFVKSTNIEVMGWLLDVLVCVERIKKQEFTLDDVYAFEPYLQAKHPLNRNGRAKTQSGQQLQIWRDKGLVRFVGRGRYRVMGLGGVLQFNPCKRRRNSVFHARRLAKKQTLTCKSGWRNCIPKFAQSWLGELCLILLKLFIEAEKNAIINFKLLQGGVRSEQTSFLRVV